MKNQSAKVQIYQMDNNQKARWFSGLSILIIFSLIRHNDHNENELPTVQAPM